MKRLIVIGVVVLALACAGVYGWQRYQKQQAAAQAQAGISIAQVERATLRTTVAATGRVVSNLDVEIKCKASGEVIKLPFDVSDIVAKGDLLLELDPVDENRAVAQAMASLEASQARLAMARQNLEIAQGNLETSRQQAKAALPAAQARAVDAQTRAERMAMLFERKLASQEDYDAARTTAVTAQTELRNAQVAIEDLEVQELQLELRRQEIRLAQTQVESDELTLGNARQRLEDTKVVAPIDGVVADRFAQIGQIISSGITNVGGGTTVLTLSDLSRIFIEASVDESDIGRVRLDQVVEITADAYPNRRFPGKVIRIATRGINTSNVVTFDVKIEVMGEQMALLKPEMTANVNIIVEERKDVLTVPVGAVRRQQGKMIVSVMGADGVASDREVTAGLSDGSRREIRSGLEEGQSVQVHPPQIDSRWAGAQRGGRTMMGGRR